MLVALHELQSARLDVGLGLLYVAGYTIQQIENVQIKIVYLKYKFAKDKIIEQNVIFSKGTVIEGGSFI